MCDTKYFCYPKCIYQFERNKKSAIKESLLSTFLNLFAKALSKSFIEQADAVLCVSKAQREILIKHIPLISQKTHVIYNPLPNLSPLEVKGEDFGYFGGTNLLKGFEVLYRALALLNDSSLRVHVTGLPAMNAKMQETYVRIGMVLCKRLEYNKQQAFYERIKAVIFPSIVPEPLPYVAAEAILRARILIASRIGGIPEQVKGCKGAFLFDAGNHVELAEILEYVKGLDKEIAVDLGFQNREAFVKNFNNEKTISEFMNVIAHLT
jgi:glycosyltransferase involved in cell wall biosynthesis